MKNLAGVCDDALPGIGRIDPATCETVARPHQAVLPLRLPYSPCTARIVLTKSQTETSLDSRWAAPSTEGEGAI